MFDLAAANVVLLAWFRGNMRCFVLKCVKHEGTISTWAPLAALRHSVARRRLYPFSSFLPASLFNKVRPRGCLRFFLFLMHFDSAEMRFLCGDIRCSCSKDTGGSWPSVRRAAKKNIEWYFENINECLHFNQSWVLAGPRRFTRRLSQTHFQLCLVLFFNWSIKTQNDHFLQVSDIFISEYMS